MKSLLLILPALLGYAALIYHSMRRRGWMQTLTLFGGVYLFGFVKEHNAHVFLDKAEYVYNLAGPQIDNTPLFIPIGWTFAVYISWTFAEAILDRFRKTRGSLLPILGLTVLTMIAISMCVEVTGTNTQWWIWNPEIMQHDPHDQWYWSTPIGVFVGWAIFCLAFCLPFFVVFKLKVPLWIALPLGAAIGYFTIHWSFFWPASSDSYVHMAHLAALFFFIFVAPLTTFLFKIPYRRGHLENS